MPRVVNPPRAQRMSATTPHKQSPLKIPLNDDRQEKAVRLQSRQALHNLQINQLKAAASPIRKLNNYQRAASDSPKTPRTQAAKNKENTEDGGLAIVANSAMTPMKRVPILANFEEWMKMATDNKINATNSWNFALIDYFHDMSLLKEGDGVNFQKASCTLDGCVKIYTSRVDSVATETGKLLSGLADSGNKKGRKEDAEGEAGDDVEDEEGEEGEEGSKKRQRRKRASETTLVPSFASIQLKKFELEFSVDPLFKKASADFDEGGAKGLLLNHLSIDAEGRIVFDSSDDANDITGEAEDAREEEEKFERGDDMKEPGVANIDLNALGSSYFPDLALLDEQDICPSLKNFDLGDPTRSLDIPFLKAAEDWRQEKNNAQDDGPELADQTGIVLDEDNAAGFDDDDGLLAGFDVPGDAGFGEGGEAWAKNAVIEPQVPIHERRYEHGIEEGAEVGSFDPKGNDYTVSLHHKQNEIDHEDIMSYFDNALRKNWAGPEHWRIRKIKDTNKPATSAPARRKEREPFEIDFLSALNPTLAESIYTPAASNSAISLPKTQWRSKTRNLLPDDKHFNSRELLRLFLKPKARMGSRKSGFAGKRMYGSDRPEAIPEGEIDEAYWARKESTIQRASPDDEAPEGNYDANFFQDDGLAALGGAPEDDEEFADAREAFSPVEDGDPGVGSQGIDGILSNTYSSQEGAFGTQLVTQSRRLRPEYVQYARVAKKVDVRRLKEEMWRGIGFEKVRAPDHISNRELIAVQTPKPPASTPAQLSSNAQQATLKFTSVMNDLQQAYPKQAMADISTSYCFICLLHLANEKGLLLGIEPGLAELSIQRDLTAEITEGGE
ncbi:MAG: hypothetical protein LQ343_007179 [Gyalolechia ehrenbergii]|nr:MAG: hypothetical protein LQ343_007179 [Gyalolechia ehrenbergii]